MIEQDLYYPILNSDLAEKIVQLIDFCRVLWCKHGYDSNLTGISFRQIY